MPSAYIKASGDARVPRTLFAHAHHADDAEFPPNTLMALHPRCIMQLPDNWNGTDKLYMWLYGLEAAIDCPYTIVANAGKNGEAFNIHTQTVAGKLVQKAANEYERVDLTTDLAVWIALLTSGDILWFDVSESAGVNDLVIGFEIQET